MTCDLYEDSGWVCGSYPDRPWDDEQACGCGAAEAPCAICNGINDRDAPRLRSGFKT